MAQYTAKEINAAIAHYMREEELRPLPDYINEPEDEKRFVLLAELAVRNLGSKALDLYEILQQTHGKVVALVSVLRLMDR